MTTPYSTERRFSREMERLAGFSSHTGEHLPAGAPDFAGAVSDVEAPSSDRTAVISQHTASAQTLLEPVRPGLERVEARLRAVDGSLFAPLSNAFLNLIGSGGKRLRPALALLAAGIGGSALGEGTGDPVIALAAAVEMLHTSTLVHDDVIDGALLRRGAPTLNATWSGGATVLAGNYMFGAAAQLAAETQNMTVIHIFSDTLKVIVDGELRQLLDRFQYDQPKVNYYQRIYAKTASLFCAATEGAAVLTALSSEGVDALRSYGYALGMAFQIVDDILDFTGDPSLLGKPAGSDLQQGTLTLPFFHFMHGLDQPAELVGKMEAARSLADEGDPAAWDLLVAEVAADLRASSAIAASMAEAMRLLDAARASLLLFADSPYRRSMLALCDFVAARTH